MSNAYTGEQEITLAGKTCLILFNWRAVAELRTRHKNNIIKTMLDDPEPEVIASILQVGLMHHQPDITVDDIMNASPPIYPVLKAIDSALAFAYFGPDGVENSKKNPALSKKKAKKSLLTRLLKR